MVRDATIALEDRSFYTNIGVNLRGLGRAFLSNLRGDSVQGASSITQQLVKNVLIDPKERYEQSYARKLKEAIMAIEITRKYPGREGKNQILEWYLNYNFYGNAAYGIEAAANVYYDKTVADLTLDEIAVLAAIPQYPGLNPFQSPADAYRRQRKVLTSMVEAGYLTQEQADAATRYFNTPLLNDLVEQGLLGAGRSAAGGDGRSAGHRPRAQCAGQGRPTHPGRGGRGQEAARLAVAIHPRIGPGALRGAARCAALRPPACCSSSRRSTTRRKTPTSSGRTA